MANDLEKLVSTTRSSVIEQLQSANSLYDVVRELAEVASKLPANQRDLSLQLQREALKVYEQASKISDNASSVGKNLAQMVSK